MTKQSKIGNSDNSQLGVSWLINYIERENWSLPKHIEEQAKEIEKENIAKAWDAGNHQYFCSKITNEDFEDGVEYYNEQYKLR